MRQRWRTVLLRPFRSRTMRHDRAAAASGHFGCDPLSDSDRYRRCILATSTQGSCVAAIARRRRCDDGFRRVAGMARISCRKGCLRRSGADTALIDPEAAKWATFTRVRARAIPDLLDRSRGIVDGAEANDRALLFPVGPAEWGDLSNHRQAHVGSLNSAGPPGRRGVDFNSRFGPGRGF